MSDEKKALVEQFIAASFFFPMVLCAIVVLFLIAYHRKKLQHEVDRRDALLKEQKLSIEKHQAVEAERTRIASEMHDDLGSGLTTIRYLSDKALISVNNYSEAIEIRKIAEQSNTLVRNMSEIIWAMNSRFDTAESLVAYLRRYTLEYLQEHQLPVKFNYEEHQEDAITITGEKRRNIFLVLKEVLHNTVKYAGAQSVVVEVSVKDGFKLIISEVGGKGFDPPLAKERGNGLYNVERRMNSIQGSVQYIKSTESMNIIITAPINS